MAVSNEVIMSGTNPLDLYDLFMNQLIGNDTTGWIIFISLGCAFIAIMCAKFRAPNKVTLMMLMIWGLIMSAFQNWIMVLVVITIAFTLSSALSNWFGRN